MCQISAQWALKREWKSERIATPSATYEQTTDNLRSEKIIVSNPPPPKKNYQVPVLGSLILRPTWSSIVWHRSRLRPLCLPLKKNINIVWNYYNIISTILSAYLQMNKLNGLEYFRYHVTTKNYLHINMKFSRFYGFSIRKSESKKSQPIKYLYELKFFPRN